ncbi:Mpv17-like protein [Pteropus alecto]|uniref:Mpv17-like protein n=1 Tax=Pteropus alecto TaxID=9402 RepID=L5KRY0_PTEAL|nr:Mpv17-like protein [Pteropus alecto]
MASWWRALVRAAQRHPWPTNVVLYTTLFSAGDALQQRLRGGPADWRQTGRVATVAVTFHANFNYVWLRLLERALPGRTPRAILAKLVCDQAVGGPVAVSAFYTGWGRASSSPPPTPTLVLSAIPCPAVTTCHREAVLKNTHMSEKRQQDSGAGGGC